MKRYRIYFLTSDGNSEYKLTITTPDIFTFLKEENLKLFEKNFYLYEMSDVNDDVDKLLIPSFDSSRYVAKEII